MNNDNTNMEIIKSIGSTESPQPTLSPMELETLKNSRISTKRELSPVLSNNNIQKKSVHDRKRSRSRVQLLKRFKSNQSLDSDNDVVKEEDSSKNKNGFKKILNELQTFEDTNDVTERLIKIRELETKRRNLLSDLYVPKVIEHISATSTIGCECLQIFNSKQKSEESQEVNKCNRFEKYHKDDNNKSVPIANKNFKGFCTGLGKNIVISPENLKKHSELFGDIYDVNEDILRDFRNISQNKNVSSNNSSARLHPCKDISFLQTSITDTQLLLAEDVALSVMNEVEKNDSSLVMSAGGKKSFEKTLLKNYFNGFTLDEYNSAKSLCLCFQDFIKNLEDTVNKDKFGEIVEPPNKKFKLADPPEESSSITSFNTKCSSFSEDNSKDSASTSTLNNLGFIDNDSEEQLADLLVNDSVSTDNLIIKDPKLVNDFVPGEQLKSIGTINNDNCNKKSETSIKQVQDILEQTGGKELERISNYVSSKTPSSSSSSLKSSETNSDKACKLKNQEIEDNIDFLHEISNIESNLQFISPCKPPKSTVDIIENDSSICGFQTASKKLIKLSSSALKKAQNIFNQICEVEDDMLGKENSADKQQLISSYQKVNLNSNNLCGFQTASNKPINMSSSSLKEAQKIFNQVCELDDKSGNINQKEKLRKMPSFSIQKSPNNTNSNTYSFQKDIPSSSFKEAQNTFDKLCKSKDKQIDNKSDSSKKENAFEQINKNTHDSNVCGFQTASNKPIQMSSSSLKKAQNIFDQVCEIEEKQSNSFNKKENLFEQINKISNDSDVCGFQTAPNKPIQMSSTSLKKARSIFDQVCETEDKQIDGKSDDFNKENLYKQINKNIYDTNICGFQTASNKPLKMSSSSLKNAQNIFDQVCETEEKQSVDKSNDFDKKESLYRPINKNVYSNVCGFQTASNKPSKMSSSSLRKAQNIFDQIYETEDKQINDKSDDFDKRGLYKQINKNTDDPNVFGFQTASNKPLKISSSSLMNAQNIFDQVCETEDKHINDKSNDFDKKESLYKPINKNAYSNVCGFQTASNKPLKMSSSSLRKAQNIFDQICETEDKQINDKSDDFNKRGLYKQINKDAANPNVFGFQTASNKPLKMSSSSLKKAEDIFNQVCELENDKDENCKETSSIGFSAIPGKDFNTSGNAWGKTNKVCNDQFRIDPLQKSKNTNVASTGFSSAGGKAIKISNEAWRKANAVFDTDDLNAQSVTATNNKSSVGPFVEDESFFKMDLDGIDTKNDVSEQVSPENTINQKTVNTSHTNALSRSAKKRLGISRCKQLPIATDKLKGAKLIFEDFEDSNKSNNKQNNSQLHNNVSIIYNQPQIHTSTPLKTVPNMVKNTILESIKESSLTEINLTPVKPEFKNVIEYKKNEANSSVIVQEQTKGGIEDWVGNIDKEFADLQNRMKIILERKTALQRQKQLMESSDSGYKRQRPGTLLNKKRSGEKVSLKDFLNNRTPNAIGMDEALKSKVSYTVLEITPSNAQFIHFNCKNNPIINTVDGAVIIPNSENVIGLSELKVAFETMPGVDRKLLPNGWIDNHFKWIVWKLASIERNFPDIFSECLSLENVMQQLKYRYDREIDKAERPALRKILEKDDVPQKRMVLCISDIIKVSDQIFELELTDGWYAIRTLIDQLLCKQIYTSKIKIGTKLVIQCAEILNCDGCHPLDIPNHVKLKINYNCTRRGRWYSKLGYQSIAEPFPIRLKTIHPDGGAVAYIKIQIVRVYPLRYMERHAGKTVWRNKRAEEKHAQEWENQRMKNMEMIRHKVLNDYEKEMCVRKDFLSLSDNGNIKEINSPKLLYQMLEYSHDPEGLKNMLSSSQISAAMDYRATMYSHHQQEIAHRISEQIKKLKCVQRDVVSVLRLRVIDITDPSQDSFFLSIWKPTEDHLQMLQEECSFSIYNVLPKQNNNFTTTARTHFKRETQKILAMQRQLLPISKIKQSCKILFNEYDTVGTVVQIYKKAHHQELWLTDCDGRLLFIKILDRLEQCCLLDNLNRSQNIAIMNLVHTKVQDAFAQAIANQYTIITCYPQHKFLQEALTAYTEQLPKNLTVVLSECDKKIELRASNMQFSKNHGTSFAGSTGSPSLTDVLDDSSEDNTLILSRLTTTDVAMSLIDMDQFFKNI